MENIDFVDGFADEVKSTLKDNISKFPVAFNSPHEAYAVLLEEVDELWSEVKKKAHNRDMNIVRMEAMDIAVVAMRIAMMIQQ